MSKVILSLLLVTAFTCQRLETPWQFSGNMFRCENDEVICYYFTGSYKGGISCKFKDQSDNVSKKEAEDD